MYLSKFFITRAVWTNYGFSTLEEKWSKCKFKLRGHAWLAQKHKNTSVNTYIYDHFLKTSSISQNYSKKFHACKIFKLFSLLWQITNLNIWIHEVNSQSFWNKRCMYNQLSNSTMIMKTKLKMINYHIINHACTSSSIIIIFKLISFNLHANDLNYFKNSTLGWII